MKRKKWTKEEDELLREKYPDAATADLLVLFPGLTIKKILSHANFIGVRKSAAFFESSFSGRISSENDIGVNTRFNGAKPGWNKGLKIQDYISPESYERMKTSHFKHGNVPGNWKPVGSERITKDGYIELKVRDLNSGLSIDNFELKHRWIYEQNHGPIAEGMIVVFKDGDKMNFDIENLRRNFLSDSCIVKKFMGIKDEKTVQLIIDHAPETIELQRKIYKVKKEIKCRM